MNKMTAVQLRNLARIGAIEKLKEAEDVIRLIAAEFPELVQPTKVRRTSPAVADAPYGINPRTGQPYRVSTKARRNMAKAAKHRASTKEGKAHLRRIGRNRGER